MTKPTPGIAMEDKSLLAQEREELGPDYVVFDHNNPRSLINMVPESLKKVMNSLDDKHRYLTETNLRKFADADARLAQLRIAFWIEYNSAQKVERKMSILNVYRGIASQDFWENVILKDPKKVAYIIVPPKDYLVAMNELLELGMDRMREILKAPLYDKNGKFDPKVADKVIRVAHAVEARVKGAVVTKTLNLNADVNPNKLGIDAVDTNTTSLEELEAQVARVKAKLEGKDKLQNSNCNDEVEDGIVITNNDSGVIEGEVVAKSED